MADRVPLVDYLVLSEDPRLVARECERCAARFFDRRNACASCGATTFRGVDIPRTGTLVTYTIVSVAPPGVAVPFVAAVVDCGGTAVRGNLVNVAPDPGRLTPGMELRLTTVSVGTDGAGTEAVGYGFEPA
ncbi:OB-fold domain-containing protein [Frankia sp. CNm7]|uniref:OB-fold domain-containing protein n=1 Tax=Frankia nepalensis TaxID=1836974 RepID=A0A937RDU3_9ACTN|nr:OB-fold domain-containing protein [Frankia nepalensis]MBL7502266.1 OB-fold domain-containing protein [Frankia nepalensis]MBL7515958.1 OB-fold domain-containing protein [Frankia nepalensis]MBL7522547.1 OB-fold domain-containing protein [Frankia nepalensis]MBL7627160.1 OB-fold domain-containing protein [Frankia nepalensis]